MKYSRVIALTVASCAFTAHADMIEIGGGVASSIEQTGSSFVGSLEYSFDGGTVGTLTISLTNTTSASVGGYLTGFVVNLDSVDAGASIQLSSASDADFLDTGVESASPFGTYDGGAAIGANWTGGGNPSNGMGAGASEVFAFTINASDAGTLSASSFLRVDSDIAVRFRGLLDGGSDKITNPAPGTTAIAILGIWTAGRRRRI